MTRKSIEVETKEKLFFDQRENNYVVKEVDWRRIKSAVHRLPQKTGLFDNAAWACFGIAATFLVAAITLPSSAQNLSVWVTPTCWIGTIATAVLGFLSLTMQRHYNTHLETSREDCLVLLNDVEVGFSAVEVPERVATQKVTVSSDPMQTKIDAEPSKSLTQLLDSNIKKSVFGKSE